MKKIVLCLLMAASPFFAIAQERPPYGPMITSEQAKKIAVNARAEAEKNGWRVAIAIVDTHGLLVYYERMDDTQTASVQIALDKAKTAAMFRRSTKSFEDAIKGGRLALLGVAGVTPIEGGIPIFSEGKVIGAIGVSGVNSDQDAVAALAGIKNANLQASPTNNK